MLENLKEESSLSSSMSTRSSRVVLCPVSSQIFTSMFAFVFKIICMPTSLVHDTRKHCNLVSEVDVLTAQIPGAQASLSGPSTESDHVEKPALDFDSVTVGMRPHVHKRRAAISFPETRSGSSKK